MALLYRIKRLIKADAHALVEELEEPKWILAQAIRDMEQELERQNALLAEMKGRLEKMQKQQEDAQKFLSQAEADIELAMEEKREDIARALIRKVIVHRKNLAVFHEQEEMLKKEITVQEQDVAAKRRSYEEVCARSQVVTFPAKDSGVFHESRRLVEKEANLEHEVELEFLRRLKSRKGGAHGK